MSLDRLGAFRAGIPGIESFGHQPASPLRVAESPKLPFRQGRVRTAELVTGPGYIEIKKAGTRAQRIDARSINGGTTARTSKGILFTLSHAKRDQPVTIEVESDADADRVRLALGIGHGGFGSVGWRTVPSASAKTVHYWKYL